MNLFIRAGDGDHYNDFGTDLAAAAEYLNDCEVLGPITRCQNVGHSFVTPNMKDWNCLSIFWGETAGNPQREATDEEIAKLNANIRTAVKVHYDNGECPDCGEPIPNDATDGDECSNCEHVFWSPDAVAEQHRQQGEVPCECGDNDCSLCFGSGWKQG